METKGTRSEAQDLPQAEKKHPDEWERDLNPDRMAGQNIGERSAEREQGWMSAHEVKDLHRQLSESFTDEELKKIPVVKPGTRLQQGATYVDLTETRPEEFTATGEMEAEEDGYFVAKDRVPYSLWNRLIGVDNPERTLEERSERDR